MKESMEMMEKCTNVRASQGVGGCNKEMKETVENKQRCGSKWWRFRRVDSGRNISEEGTGCKEVNIRDSM